MTHRWNYGTWRLYAFACQRTLIEFSSLSTLEVWHALSCFQIWQCIVGSKSYRFSSKHWRFLNVKLSTKPIGRWTSTVRTNQTTRSVASTGTTYFIYFRNQYFITFSFHSHLFYSWFLPHNAELTTTIKSARSFVTQSLRWLTSSSIAKVICFSEDTGRPQT